MMNFKPFIVIIIVCLKHFCSVSDAVSFCGDWVPYKDEKCFMVLDKYGTESEAEYYCQLQDSSSTLITIHSNEEQIFLTNFLFKSKNILDNVWIGMKKSNNIFNWLDYTTMRYTNWVNGGPLNETGYDCVQMAPEASTMGKWVNEPCGKKHLVVCEKLQSLSLSQLQKIILDTRTELNHLQKNPVPIGFIYVQLPNQTEPNTIWSGVEWKDVTSEYAGLFFRAEGGGSAAFGVTQSENYPNRYIDSIGNNERNISNYKYWGNFSIPESGWSPYILSGSYASGTDYYGMRFHTVTNAGENIPVNKAVRIWKRIN